MLTRCGRRNLGRRIGSTDFARRAVIALLICGACSSCVPLVKDGSSELETQRRPSNDTIPIVYQSKRFTPLPLAPQQIDEIMTLAYEAMPNGPSVWFIFVRANSKLDDELSYNAFVYFRPDEATARFRKGRYLHLDNWWKSLGITINTVLNNHQTDLTIRLLSYCQVSQADRPFGKKLDVPNGPMLPFDAPEGFEVDEIVDIVDFVRSSPIHTPPQSKEHPNSFRYPEQVDGSAPFVLIKRKADTIWVQTGTVEGMFSGMGQLLLLVRDGEEFKITSIGTWVY